MSVIGVTLVDGITWKIGEFWFVLFVCSLFVLLLPNPPPKILYGMDDYVYDVYIVDNSIYSCSLTNTILCLPPLSPTGRYAIEDMGAVQVEISPAPLKSQPSFEAGVEVTFGQRKNRRLKMPLTWLGIFDGHGGDKASQFCSDWLSSYVRNEESYPFDLGYSMKKAFTAIDEDFVATGHPDGSTACAATLVGGRRIVCANAGDSRAIVVRRDGTVVRLSRDHKPGMPDETRRISELGGRVIYWGRWRVEGLLAVSRSIGDASLKPYVCADPEVCEYDIGKDDWFLIMSSDGVWDVMDNEEAAHVVIASSCVMEEGKLKIDTNRFKWAARNLCDHAKSCGSTDNFSVIVVDLKSCGNPQAKVGRYLP